jgi:hypothetical protein
VDEVHRSWRVEVEAATSSLPTGITPQTFLSAFYRRWEDMRVLYLGVLACAALGLAGADERDKAPVPPNWYRADWAIGQVHMWMIWAVKP